MATEPPHQQEWLSRYNFIMPIGEGGMGQVYLAEDLADHNRQVVIKQTKIFEKEEEEKEEMRRVFRRESEILAKLNHRGIVKLTDKFYDSDFMFLVMEYVPGQNLSIILSNEGPLSSETVIKIGIQCCDVLEYLHGLTPPIIYRDLKPSNLILRPDGLVVFVDFGIAKDFEPKGPSTRVVTSGYAPPEQYFGKPEPRGDLYSLGATMHQLVTGVRPRPLTPCSPSNVLPTVSKELDALVRQMTSHDIDQRPPSARAVQFELFRAYKVYHPDFEIPDLGVDDDDEDVQDDRLLAGLRTMNLKTSLTGERKPRQASQFKQGDDTCEEETTTQRQTLLEKFKQWVGEWKGWTK